MILYTAAAQWILIFTYRWVGSILFLIIFHFSVFSHSKLVTLAYEGRFECLITAVSTFVCFSQFPGMWELVFMCQMTAVAC